MKESNIRNWFLNDCNKIYFWKYFYIMLNMSLWRQGLLINNKIKLDLVWLKNIKIQNGQNATSYISLADLAMNLNFSTCILILQMSPLSWLYFFFFLLSQDHTNQSVSCLSGNLTLPLYIHLSLVSVNPRPNFPLPFWKRNILPSHLGVSSSFAAFKFKCGLCWKT